MTNVRRKTRSNSKKSINIVLLLQASTVLLSAFLLMLCAVLGYIIIKHQAQAVGEGTHYYEAWRPKEIAFTWLNQTAGFYNLGAIFYNYFNANDTPIQTVLNPTGQACATGRWADNPTGASPGEGGPYFVGGCMVSVISWDVYGSIVNGTALGSVPNQSLWYR